MTTAYWEFVRDNVAVELTVRDDEAGQELFHGEIFVWGNGFGFKLEPGQFAVFDADNRTVIVTSAGREYHADVRDKFNEFVNAMPALPGLAEEEVLEDILNFLENEEGEEE